MVVFLFRLKVATPLAAVEVIALNDGAIPLNKGRVAATVCLRWRLPLIVHCHNTILSTNVDRISKVFD